MFGGGNPFLLILLNWISDLTFLFQNSVPKTPLKPQVEWRQDFSHIILNIAVNSDPNKFRVQVTKVDRKNRLYFWYVVHFSLLRNTHTLCQTNTTNKSKLFQLIGTANMHVGSAGQHRQYSQYFTSRESKRTNPSKARYLPCASCWLVLIGFYFKTNNKYENDNNLLIWFVGGEYLHSPNKSY